MGFEKMHVGNRVKEGRDRNPNDHYPTPPIATYALHLHERLPQRIWEPAAGRGWMARELARLGYDVHATDLHQYEEQLFDVWPWIDFIDPSIRLDVDAIVTNPPYGQDMAEKFIHSAHKLGYLYTAFLCRLTFAESTRRYRNLFRDTPPTRVLAFTARFNCDESLFDEGKQLGGMVPYAWWIWDRRDTEGRWTTTTQLKWIDTLEANRLWLTETASIPALR